MWNWKQWSIWGVGACLTIGGCGALSYFASKGLAHLVDKLGK